MTHIFTSQLSSPSLVGNPNDISNNSETIYNRFNRSHTHIPSIDDEIIPLNDQHLQSDTHTRRFHNTFQAQIYNFLERPCGIICFLYHFSVFVIVIACLVYSSILTVHVQESNEILFWIELVLFNLFLSEYIIRIWSAGCRSKYRGRKGRLLFMRKAMCMVDLFVIIGYAILLCIGMFKAEFSSQLLRYVRILQILRFLHVDRRLTSWRLLGSVVYDHRYELVATLYFCFIFLIVVAYLIWLVEKDETKDAADDVFHSFADTLWWAIITMATIGYGDKCPRTHIGKMITSCLCICGVAFWTLPSGIIGSGFALKVEQKKREKQFNRLVPAAAGLIQNWWRMVASRHPILTATWCIYSVETKRFNRNRHIESNMVINLSRTMGASSNINNNIKKLGSWRKVENQDDLEPSQRTAIRILRIIKFHAAKRKFQQAHKPYDFKDIMDENAQGNLKVMYTLAEIQRRLDQTLGLPKSYPLALTDKEREQLTLNAKVQRLETKLATLEKQTSRVISLLEDLHRDTTNINCQSIQREATISEMTDTS
ncbi:unnamed protein product [Didymodactylos carnosus]|uniref:Uncharacterized protein n=1 Tax=Didymodactylos carnosus TaxID=1234261 RepID=A0A8S2DAF5_9BILA|nr:unnamed protein product [Didymodactylos carnosus]CAF3637737.1 unnamed protein product [Didymodactylos carnosus]